MQTSFPWSPKSPLSANVSACLRAVGIFVYLTEAQMCLVSLWWGVCRETLCWARLSPLFAVTQYQALELACPNSGKVARDPALPTEQGKELEHQPLLPAFLFSFPWWKGLKRDRSTSIKAVNKKRAFGGMKERGWVCLCLLKNATCHLQPQVC